jgi:hypothetical protein
MAPRAGPWLVDPVELNQMAGKRGIGWISMWRPLQPPSVNLIQIPSARLLFFLFFKLFFINNFNILL